MRERPWYDQERCFTCNFESRGHLVREFFSVWEGMKDPWLCGSYHTWPEVLPIWGHLNTVYKKMTRQGLGISGTYPPVGPFSFTLVRCRITWRRNTIGKGYGFHLLYQVQPQVLRQLWTSREQRNIFLDSGEELRKKKGWWLEIDVSTHACA